VTSGFCNYSISILAGTVQTFDAGDMLIMLGDVNHAGVAWDNVQPNIRLFCYLPTAYCLPTWDSVNATGEVMFCSLEEVPDDGTNCLRNLTSPTHARFNQDSFDKHLFCSQTGKFFKFDSVAYYEGLQTITSRPSIYSSTRTKDGAFFESPGCCKHWPNQASLSRAGMVGNTFRDLRRSVDCPSKEDDQAECVQSLPVKRIKGESSSESAISPNSTKSVTASGQETLSIQLECAKEQIRLLNILLAAKEEIITQLKKRLEREK
jgi:hypothetical protein